MPLSPTVVYRLSDIHRGTNNSVTIVTDVRVRKEKDVEFGHDYDLYCFLSNTPYWDAHTFHGSEATEQGDAVDVVDDLDPTILHRFEPLTMDLWQEMGPYVFDWKAASKNFSTDEEIQNFFREDLNSEDPEPAEKSPDLNPEEVESDLEESKKIRTSVSLPVSSVAAASSGLPVGTIHIWSDGNKHQKQLDGSWPELPGSKVNKKAEDELLASHPQLQPVSSSPDEVPEEEPAASQRKTEAPPAAAVPLEGPPEAATSPESAPEAEAPKRSEQDTKTADIWIDKAEGVPANSRNEYSRLENGTRVYSPERQAIHGIIEDSLTQHVTPADKSTMPVAVLTLGLPASGKSKRAQQLWEGKNVAFIDPDEIKKLLPDYQQALGQKARNAADIVHNESGDIADKVLSDAIKGRLNFVFDGVGRDLVWYSNLVMTLKQKGYYVYAMMQHVTDLEKLLARAEDRGRREGRFTDVEGTKAHFDKLPKNFRAMDRLVHSTIISNGDDLDVEPFYERHDGLEPIIHDQAKYEKYKAMSESIMSRLFMNEAIKSSPHLPPALDPETVKAVYASVLKDAGTANTEPEQYAPGQGVLWPLGEH